MEDYNHYKSMIEITPVSSSDYRKLNKSELDQVYNEPKIPENEKSGSLARTGPFSVHSETLASLRKPIPFALFHKYDDIIRRKYPWVLPEPVPASDRINRKKEELSRNTRPRVVMLGGGMSLDDIINQNARDIIIKNTYKTTTMDVYGSLLKQQDNIRTPLDGTYSKSYPTAIPYLQHQYISPEWRMDSVTWDRNGIRGFCSPTKKFWLRNIKKKDENKELEK